MGKQLDGKSQTQESTKESTEESVVEKIISRQEVDTSEKEEEAKQETSKEETNVEAESETPEETETEEIVIKANEDIVVTEEIAEELGLDKEFIGKTVQFSEDEIAELSEKLEDTTESVSDMEITEELAKTLGLPKTFIGKPLSEAGKSYKETVKWENENNKQIKNLQKTVEDLVNKLSDKEISQIERDATAEAAETIPDPYTEPERFAEWLQKREELIAQKVLSKIEENPSIKAAGEIATKQMEEATIQSLQAGLPEGIQASDVMDKWFEENKDDFKVMVKTGIYKNKPTKLVKDVLNWYKASSYDSLKNSKESEVKKQVHKKTVENLKAKGNKTKINYSSNPRAQSTKSDSVVSRVLKNLEERAALKGSS